MPVETIRWEGGRPGRVRLLEQTLLPLESRYVEVETAEEMIDAIRRLAVRGAPAIGVAAAYGLCLAVQGLDELPPDELFARVRSEAERIAAARPTAVNLGWALRRAVARAEREHAAGRTSPELLDALLEEASAIAEEDAGQCTRMGELGAALLCDGMTVLTHCNAGALATAGSGTALAPIYEAVRRGMRVNVFAGETRPLLQGARLTAWELGQAGVDVTLITDSMAGSVMSAGKVDAVLVGADRIARNGDVANKIGTYTVAVLAARHGIPFYVVAPLSTFDADVASGAEIPIEERSPDEVVNGFGRRTAPEGVRVHNPAFDVTPAELVTAIVTDAGLVERPSLDRVEAFLRANGRI